MAAGLKAPDFCWLLPGGLRSGTPPPPQFSATWRPRPQSTQTESSVWQHNHRRDAHHLCTFCWLEAGPPSAHPKGAVTWRVDARRGPGATPRHDCALSPPGHRLPFPDPAAFLACFMIMAPFLSLSVGVRRGPSRAEATQGCARSVLSRGPRRQGAPPSAAGILAGSPQPRLGGPPPRPRDSADRAQRVSPARSTCAVSGDARPPPRCPDLRAGTGPLLP